MEGRGERKRKSHSFLLSSRIYYFSRNKTQSIPKKIKIQKIKKCC